MGEVSLYRLRQFQRRAETNLRRVNDLSGDMIAALGVEDQLTDYSDGAVEQAENLVAVLDTAIKLRQKP